LKRLPDWHTISTMKPVHLLLPLTLLGTSAIAGDLYKWRDEAGRTRYTDRQPPPTAKNVQKLKAGSASLSTEKSATAAQPFESTQAASKYPVLLFSFAECGAACRNAEAFLDKRGIPYTLKNKDDDKTELKQLTGGLAVPVLLVGKEMSTGFDAEAWGRLLDAAGYAKSNPYAKSGKPKTTTETSPAPVAETPLGR